MNIDYTVQIWQEGGQFIAHAMPLDIMSSEITPRIRAKHYRRPSSCFLQPHPN